MAKKKIRKRQNDPYEDMSASSEDESGRNLDLIKVLIHNLSAKC